ncbi:MAG: hypothetical protein IJC90_08065 [Clostridia bacterium]|nr:hypothetical protein [Clostridia bacterium]
MVQKFIKNIANENAMKISKNVAYGNVGGYMATLKGGYETSTISFSGAFTDESANKISAVLSDKEFIKEHHVMKFRVLRESVTAEFQNTFNTEKKMKGFIKAFPEVLKENGVIGDGFCTACGNTIESEADSNIVLINGIAHRVHKGCTSSLNERADIEQAKHETEEKNLGKGILGAFLGSILGGVAWAIVYYIGYFASIVGLLIGFLATKGYEKLGGKVCKAKMPIILIATVFGAIFGQVVGDIAAIYVMMAPEGYYLMDIPYLYMYALGDSEFMTTVLGNLAIGIIFALGGAIGILRKTSKENKDAALRTEVLE